MSWLAPWYLMGLAAVAGPLVFHLWRQSAQGQRRFSSLMFLDPSPPRLTRVSRLQHVGLFACRALVLTCLAVALARPVFRHTQMLPVVPDGGELVCVLVDTSASLQRERAWPTLLAQLDRRLQRLHAADRVALLSFARTADVRIPFNEARAWSTAQPEMQAELSKLRPTWDSGLLGEALVEAVELLEVAQSQAAWPRQPRIILASDMAAGSSLSALKAMDWPGEVRLELLPVAVSPESNLGLQWVAEAQTRPTEALRVRITHSGAGPRRTARLHWNESPEAFAELDLATGQSRTVALPDRPPSAEFVRLTGDEHPFDNQLWLPDSQREPVLIGFSDDTVTPPDSVSPSKDIPTATSSPTPTPLPTPTAATAETNAPAAVGSLRFFWEEALRSHPLLNARLVDRHELSANPDLPVGLVVITAADVPDQAWIDHVLLHGRQLLLVANDAQGFQKLLNLVGLPTVTATDVVSDPAVFWSKIDFRDPLFAPFAEAQFSDFSAVRVRRYGRLTWSSDVPSDVLVRFNNGDPALVRFPRGEGAVWGLAAGWNPIDSDWGRSSKFAPWCWRLVELTQPSQPLKSAMPVGAAVPAAVLTAGDISVTRPDGNTSVLSRSDAERFRFDHPGAYQVTANVSSAVTRRFAIHVPPDESQTQLLDPSQLEAFGVRLASSEAPNATLAPTLNLLRQQQLLELEQEQRGWWWLMLAALVLVLLETWWAQRRRAIVETNSSVPSTSLETTP
jgi:hypothetical protein